MPVSIDDVARKAGVSRGTVSQVLNENTSARISAATRERVRNAARELGYQPNLMARSLGRRRTDTIGLIISSLSNQFYVQLAEHIERVALAAGYRVLVDATPPDARIPSKLRGWPVDGTLMWASPDQSLQGYLGPQSQDMPVVYLSGQPRDDDADSAMFDVYTGARQAMLHLVDRGYRRIAYLVPFDWVLQQPNEPRWSAYREVCYEAGITQQLIQQGRREETRRAGLEAGLEIAAMPIEERPRAILCWNDMIAQGVLFGLRRAGLKVPEDIALVGFDGLEETRYLDVPLTTVLCPPDELAATALDILFRRIAQGSDLPSQHAILPTTLRQGGTT